MSIHDIGGTGDTKKKSATDPELDDGSSDAVAIDIAELRFEQQLDTAGSDTTRAHCVPPVNGEYARAIGPQQFNISQLPRDGLAQSGHTDFASQPETLQRIAIHIEALANDQELCLAFLPSSPIGLAGAFDDGGLVPDAIAPRTTRKRSASDANLEQPTDSRKRIKSEHTAAAVERVCPASPTLMSILPFELLFSTWPHSAARDPADAAGSASPALDDMEIEMLSIFDGPQSPDAIAPEPAAEPVGQAPWKQISDELEDDDKYSAAILARQNALYLERQALVTPCGSDNEGIFDDATFDDAEAM